MTARTTPYLVLTIDQRGSRQDRDRVPDALGLLAAVPTRRPFERTVGDEFQGVLDQPTALPEALEPLLRDGRWNIGIGIGAVDEPLPARAPEGSGPAFLHAREAVTTAKHSPWHLRVDASPEAGGAARALETVCWLWAAVLARRTDRGWEVADLITEGLSYAEAGNRLGISQSAVSQRAAAAGIVEARRARELITDLAGQLLGKGSS